MKKTKISCIHEISIEKFQEELGEEIEFIEDQNNEIIDIKYTTGHHLNYCENDGLIHHYTALIIYKE